jgi:hypothetical protein
MYEWWNLVIYFGPPLLKSIRSLGVVLFLPKDNLRALKIELLFYHTTHIDKNTIKVQKLVDSNSSSSIYWIVPNADMLNILL